MSLCKEENRKEGRAVSFVSQFHRIRLKTNYSGRIGGLVGVIIRVSATSATLGIAGADRVAGANGITGTMDAGILG